MKKVFGVQAEINITADDDVVRGIGKGIQNGSVIVSDIVKELKPFISDRFTEHLRGRLEKQDDKDAPKADANK